MKRNIFKIGMIAIFMLFVTAPIFAQTGAAGGVGAGAASAAAGIIAAMGAGAAALRKKFEKSDDSQFEADIKSLPDDQKEVMRTIRKQMNATVNEMLVLAPDETALKAAFDDYQTQIKEELKGENAQLAENVNKVLLSLKGQIEASKMQAKQEVKDLSLKGQILGQITTTNEKGEVVYNESYENFKAGRQKNFELNLDLKAAANMTVAGNVTGNFVTGVTSETSITDLIRRIPIFKGYTNYSRISTPRFTYVEKKNPDGTITMVAEGAAKPKIDFDLVGTEVKAKKVAGNIKISTEILDDVEGIASEIDSELRYQVESKIDTQLISGDGTGENLTGVATIASAFTATALVTTGANNYDCLKACATQIRLAEGLATHAFMNPLDSANMEFAKDSTGQYIMPPFTSADGKTISGLKIVETTAIPAGYLLVGDMRKVFVKEYKTFTATMGWENDDFTKNFVTVVGEARIMEYVKTNHVSQFVYDTFANIKTALA